MLEYEEIDANADANDGEYNGILSMETERYI